MKEYDLIIRTKGNKRFQSIVKADDYEAAQEKIEIRLSENKFIKCYAEGYFVFLAVSEIGYVALKDNQEN